ncbi:hypothetical protein [Pseudomonas serbica]
MSTPRPPRRIVGPITITFSKGDVELINAYRQSKYAFFWPDSEAADKTVLREEFENAREDLASMLNANVMAERSKVGQSAANKVKPTDKDPV